MLGRPLASRERGPTARRRHLSPPFQTLAGSCGKFAPFEIKENMVLAPRCRTVFDQELSDQLDQLLLQQNGDFSFLKDLKGRRPLWSGPTVVSNRGADIFNRSVSLPWVNLALVAELWVLATAGSLGPRPGARLPGHRPWLRCFIQLLFCFREPPKSLGRAPGAQAACLASCSPARGAALFPRPHSGSLCLAAAASLGGLRVREHVTERGPCPQRRGDCGERQGRRCSRKEEVRQDEAPAVLREPPTGILGNVEQDDDGHPPEGPLGPGQGECAGGRARLRASFPARLRWSPGFRKCSSLQAWW